MNNAYFKNMRKEAAAHKRRLDAKGLSIKDHPLFSKGQACAYREWAIARTYEQSEITVAELLDNDEDLKDFIDTLRSSEITSIVVGGPAQDEISRLLELGCKAGEECSVRGLLAPRSIDPDPGTVRVKGQRVYL